MLERLHDVSEATELLGTELREHDAQMQALPRGRTRAGREGRRCIGDADQQHRFVLDADDGAWRCEPGVHGHRLSRARERQGR